MAVIKFLYYFIFYFHIAETPDESTYETAISEMFRFLLILMLFLVYSGISQL